MAVVMPGFVLVLYCAGWGVSLDGVRPRIRYCATPASSRWLG
jgi:hypothetical protein